MSGWDCNCVSLRVDFYINLPPPKMELQKRLVLHNYPIPCTPYAAKLDSKLSFLL
jgi:hypothetical protein